MEPINNNSNVCFVCYNSEKPLLKCSVCQSIFYCSVEHQKQDWKNHSSTCKTLDGRLLVTQPAKQMKSFQAKLKRAESLRTSRQSEKALTLLQEIAESTRTISSANVGMAMCYMSLEQYQKAFEQANLALSRDPNQVECSSIRAEVFLQMGQLQEAQNDILRLRRTKSTHAGVTLLEKQFMDAISSLIEDTPQVEACLNNILKKDPKCYRAIDAKGAISILRNDAVTARKYFDLSIKLCNTFYGSFARRAALNMDEGRFDDAELDCLMALNLMGNTPNPDLQVIEQLHSEIQAKEQRTDEILTRLQLKIPFLQGFAGDMD